MVMIILFFPHFCVPLTMGSVFCNHSLPHPGGSVRTGVGV